MCSLLFYLALLPMTVWVVTALPQLIFPPLLPTSINNCWERDTKLHIDPTKVDPEVESLASVYWLKAYPTPNPELVKFFDDHSLSAAKIQDSFWACWKKFVDESEKDVVNGVNVQTRVPQGT